MDLVFCDFCLSYNVKVFNISKEIEQKPIANVEHSGFLETVAELAAKVVILKINKRSKHSRS